MKHRIKRSRTKEQRT